MGKHIHIYLHDHSRRRARDEEQLWRAYWKTSHGELMSVPLSEAAARAMAEAKGGTARPIKSKNAQYGKSSDADQLFSSGQLKQLKAEYAKIQSVDPGQPSYGKMTAMLGGLSQGQLKQLASAGIKFVSNLARNRVQRDADEPGVRWNPAIGRFENTQEAERRISEGMAAKLKLYRERMQK